MTVSAPHAGMIAADAVVIGGGLLGLAVTHYLSKLGTGNVVVVERRLLAEQNTSRAAALLTQLRAKECLISLVQETYRVIGELEHLLDDSLGLRQVGSLHVASLPESKSELEQLNAIGRARSVKREQISPRQATDLAPWLAMSEDAYVPPRSHGCIH